MFNDLMLQAGKHSSVIRELNDFGRIRARELGEDSVFDFSIGGPSIPVPYSVRQKILELASEEDSVRVHGYSPSKGFEHTREQIAKGIERRFGVAVPADLIYMTCGASAALAISINALCEPGDEFILCAPYFTEYPVYVRAAGGIPVTVPFLENFDVDLNALANSLTSRTKAVIVNSPNNPSGKVYSEALIQALARILGKKSAQTGKPIFIISDEPYRELVYDGVQVPFVMAHYPHTVICYSYSKTFSVPGERIGYIAVSPSAAQARDLFCAIEGAGRTLGYVCAPSMLQMVVAECESEKPNVGAYAQNRKLIYDGLTQIGFECVPPEGAFYLFVKAPRGDSEEFSLRARKYGILIVPGDDFAAKGYCRVAYCVDERRIMRALPLFAKLKAEYDE